MNLLLYIQHSSSGQWFRVLMENNITHQMTHASREVRPSWAEVKHPEVNLEITWDNLVSGYNTRSLQHICYLSYGKWSMIFCPVLLGSSGYRCPTSCQIYAICTTLLPAQKSATPIIKAIKECNTKAIKECNIKDQGDHDWNCWDSPVFLSSMSCWDYAVISPAGHRLNNLQ